MTSGARLKVLVIMAWLAFAGLASRLYALQVKRVDEFRTRAERRRRRIDFLPPRRGKILDRAGRALALDRAVEDVVIELTELDPALDLVPAVGRATRAPIHEVAKALKAARERVREGAKVAEVGVAQDEAARGRIERLGRRFPGLVAAPRAAGGWSVMAPASIVGVRDQRLERLAALLGEDPLALRLLVQNREDEIRAIPNGADGRGRYERLRAWGEPLLVAEDVSFDKAAALEEASTDTPGFAVVRRFVRTYPRGAVASHVVGFLGKLSDAEAAALKKSGELVDESDDAGGLLLGVLKDLPANARLRSMPIGRAGLEGRLEKRLAGVPGARVVERDAGDRSRTVFLDVPPQDGEDVRLSLDLDLQLLAEAALDEAVTKHGEPGAGGAAVVLDVATGEILALASAPRFDPNIIASTFGELAKDPATPFCHRAVAAVPPGSTFKVVTSLAFFGGDGLPTHWTSDCAGALVAGQKGFHCDDVHGSNVGLAEALAHSCNVFFFRAADARGSDPIRLWGGELGFGKLVAPPTPLEQAGRIPGGVGPIVRNTAIGQGDVRATPLQVAQLAAIVGTGGRAPHARLFEEPDTDSEQRVGYPTRFGEGAVSLDERVLSLVREGLEGCTKRGTASKASIGLAPLDVAGKTGTAERRKGEPNYAWFMGYYPASAPRISFAVLVDRTKGHGGDVCGPVSRKLIEAYARSRGEEPKRR